MGPIPSLKQLSILAVLQGLLNSQAKQAYLRLTFPFWKHPGWSAWHDNSLILKGTLWPWHYKYLYVQYSLVPGPGTCTFWHSYLEWWHHSTSDSGTHTSFYFYISPASHSIDLSHYLLTTEVSLGYKSSHSFVWLTLYLAILWYYRLAEYISYYLLATEPYFGTTPYFVLLGSACSHCISVARKFQPFQALPHV